MRTVADLLGMTFTAVEQTKEYEDDIITFTAENGDQYRLYHDQDCCETVGIEAVMGNLSDLVGSPLLVAEENESKVNPEGRQKENQDSFTWTDYTFETAKGRVHILWYGESNCYYSESVNFCKVGESRY